MNQTDQKRGFQLSFASFLKFISAARFLLPVLALIIALSFFISMKNDFEYAIGHFAADSIPFHIVTAGALISAAVSCVLAFAGRRSASFTAVPDESPVTFFGAVLAAVMCIAGIVAAGADISAGVQLSSFAKIAAVLLPFIGVSAILSLFRSLRFSKLRQITAIIAVVAVNFSMFADYFNFVLPLNSPIRNLVTVMKCSVLLYLLSEARFSFGNDLTRTTVPFFILSSSLTATLSLGYSAGAAAFALISPTADNPNPSVISLALYAAIGIHALGRVFSFTKYIGEYIEPPKDEKEKKEKK